MRTRTLVPVAAVALALTAAGCGDDKKTDTSTAASDSGTATATVASTADRREDHQGAVVLSRAGPPTVRRCRVLSPEPVVKDPSSYRAAARRALTVNYSALAKNGTVRHLLEAGGSVFRSPGHRRSSPAGTGARRHEGRRPARTDHSAGPAYGAQAHPQHPGHSTLIFTSTWVHRVTSAGADAIGLAAVLPRKRAAIGRPLWFMSFDRPWPTGLRSVLRG